MNMSQQQRLTQYMTSLHFSLTGLSQDEHVATSHKCLQISATAAIEVQNPI